jgi:hypothetical protein
LGAMLIVGSFLFAAITPLVPSWIRIVTALCAGGVVLYYVQVTAARSAMRFAPRHLRPFHQPDPTAHSTSAE